MKIEVSIGEVVDKVSILQIKLEKITDSAKLNNVRKEFDLLKNSMESIGITTSSPEYCQLKSVNLSIWNIEDEIRKKELSGSFDEEFIQLARSVYIRNDERACLKRSINIAYNSLIVEEKEYTEYRRSGSNG